MKPLAEPAIAAVERGEIHIVPDNRREEYFNWMRNIRDWTLSRQLVVGPSHSGVVLQGTPSRDGGARSANEMPDVRLGAPDAGSATCWTPGSARVCGRFRRWAGPKRRADFETLLPDQPVDHRLRHPVFLGRAHDHAGDSFHRRSALSRGVSALAGAHRQRRENVEVQRHGTRPGEAEPAVRHRRDAILPGVDGGAGHRHYSVRRSARRALATSRTRSGTLRDSSS